MAAKNTTPEFRAGDLARELTAFKAAVKYTLLNSRSLEPVSVECLSNRIRAGLGHLVLGHCHGLHSPVERLLVIPTDHVTTVYTITPEEYEHIATVWTISLEEYAKLDGLISAARKAHERGLAAA